MLKKPDDGRSNGLPAPGTGPDIPTEYLYTRNGTMTPMQNNSRPIKDNVVNRKKVSGGRNNFEREA